MKRHRWIFSTAPFWVGIMALSACLVAVAPSGAALVTDDFSGAFDYAGGGLNGIWTSSVNMANLSGGRYNTTANPGTLTVDDNGTYDADGDPENGISGTGWEPNRSTAPLLSVDVPAGQDFTATVKITAQTSGNWSAAGIIARANSATPPGILLNNADENYVTNFSFRTTAVNVDQGTTDNKMVQGGGVGPNNDNNIAINLDPANEPLPITLKLERVNNTVYRSWVSTDGGATYQFQSRNTPAVGNALRDPLVPYSVGLSYMNFGTLSGTTQFDDFSLNTYDKVAAPGAPVISAPVTSITVPQGTIVNLLVNNTTPGMGPLAWVRSINLPGTDAMVLASGGPPTPLLSPPINPADGSYFRWATAATAPGVYTTTVTGTNDWGQASNGVLLTITISPEPSSLVLVGLAMLGVLGSIRRRS